MNINKLRIEKLITLDIEFKRVKEIVKTYYEYEVEEDTFNNFFENIDEYTDIDQDELICILENEYFKKLAVLSMREMKRGVKFPICEEILNPTFSRYFKQINNINFTDDKENFEGINECYKVVSYKENIRDGLIKCVDFKIACVRKFIKKSLIENGGIEDEEIDIFDCARFLIDLDNRKIYMFYNEWPTNIPMEKNGYTEKKQFFYDLFKSATRGNILNFVLSDKLTEYFQDYYKDLSEGKSKKVISHIEASSIDEKVKVLKSINYEYKHKPKIIDAIKDAIDNDDYHISMIECLISGRLVKIKDNGAISVNDAGVCKEVLEYVCREFIGTNEWLDYC